ncbi:MAG: ABC transporter permease subunit [Bacteroidales bacterium]|nr:ABC transporter permease subunit [Bacteroidales bacterium]
MISTIIIKEISTILRSKVFIISFLSIFILSGVCILVQVDNFNNKQKEYSDYLVVHHQLINSITINYDNSLWLWPDKPVPNLLMFSNGIGQIMRMPSLDRNTITQLFPDVDFCTIISILFSLMAVLFSFNAICGEKEDGTLRLIFSSPMKRSTFIIAKWLGGTICLALCLVICLLFAIIVILFNANIDFQVVDWLSILSILITGVIYISLFYLIGLYISSKTFQSHISMLISLLVWGICILILPSIPDFMGKLISPSPSMAEFIYESEYQIQTEKIKSIDNIRNKYINRGYSENIIDSLSKDEIAKSLNEFNEKQNMIQSDFGRKTQLQTIISTTMALISPYSCFILTCNELTDCGIYSQIRFRNISQDYHSTLWNFIETRKEDFRKNNSSKLSLTGYPVFKYIEPSFKERLMVGGVPIIVLILYNILFFVLTFNAFLKYDLR